MTAGTEEQIQTKLLVLNDAVQQLIATSLNHCNALKAIQDDLTVHKARLDAYDHRLELLRRDAQERPPDLSRNCDKAASLITAADVHRAHARIDQLTDKLQTLADLSAQLDIDFRTHHHIAPDKEIPTGTPICEN